MMILVELCACFVIYFMVGCIVASLFSLLTESYWETTSPKHWIMDILLWPSLVCTFIVGVIDKHKEK